MTARMEVRRLATGAGWQVHDMICSAGPKDKPFEEEHRTVSIAAVTSGTFVYRTTEGKALLAPGAVLLGNHGRCYQCGHEHGTGDRCLSFQYSADCWEELVAAVPGMRKNTFALPVLPPAATLLPVTAMLEAARESGRPAMEEIALDFAAAVLQMANGRKAETVRPSLRDERRISDTLRRIECTADETEGDRLTLAALAREAGMSRYHFLRVFRGLVGMTPYQYILRTRMTRAAVRLRTTAEPVTEIAFGAGFNDLSTFNRRFRRLMGASPRLYRKRAARSVPN